VGALFVRRTPARLAPDPTSRKPSASARHRVGNAGRPSATVERRPTKRCRLEAGAYAPWKALGRVTDCFTPEECANYLRHDGYF
jgi:hypothetical protein